jgi:hypothetical protein
MPPVCSCGLLTFVLFVEQKDKRQKTKDKRQKTKDKRFQNFHDKPFL